MKENKIQETIEALTATFASGRSEALELMASGRARRTARLLAAQARLEEELGSDDPQVVELRSHLESSDALRVALSKRSVREARRAQPTHGEWLVYGQLLRADGEPAEGLKVNLVDPSGKPSVLGGARSDEFGDWAITYPECPLDAAVDEPGLHLRIYGYRNRLIYSSEGDFAVGPHPVEYLEITLPEGADAAVAVKKPGENVRPSGEEGVPPA